MSLEFDLKVYSHKMKKFKSDLLLLCSLVNLI